MAAAAGACWAAAANANRNSPTRAKILARRRLDGRILEQLTDRRIKLFLLKLWENSRFLAYTLDLNLDGDGKSAAHSERLGGNL